MASEGLHEPIGQLSPECIDRHRAIRSIMEELCERSLSTTGTRRRNTRRWRSSGFDVMTQCSIVTCGRTCGRKDRSPNAKHREPSAARGAPRTIRCVRGARIRPRPDQLGWSPTAGESDGSSFSQRRSAASQDALR